jgi:hypothetical protein
MMLPKCPCGGFPAPLDHPTPAHPGPAGDPHGALAAAPAAPRCGYRGEVEAALAEGLVRPGPGQPLSPMHSRVHGEDRVAAKARGSDVPGADPSAAGGSSGGAGGTGAELDGVGGGALVSPRLWVEQVVVRAGDVVLMHPLTLHSGTTNVDALGAPRLMITGMARVTPGAFAARGGARLMHDLAAYDALV